MTKSEQAMALVFAAEQQDYILTPSQTEKLCDVISDLVDDLEYANSRINRLVQTVQESRGYR